MPRNGSGTYSAPSNSFNPATAGNTASPTDWNNTLSDISSAISQSISTDGQTTTSQRIPFAAGVSAFAGTTSGVSFSFTSDPNTGIYSPASDKVGIVAGGTEVLRIEAALMNPVSNNTVDLGSTGTKFKDGYFAGTLTVATAAITALSGSIGGNVTFSGNLTFSGTLTLQGNNTHSGNNTFSGANSFTGANTFTSNIAIAGNSTEAAYITLAEDTDNGSNKVKVQAPSSIASDYTVTLPASAGTVALTSDIIVNTLGTYTALSGGSVDFTGIPSTAKRITINLVGMSTNGSDLPRIQIGDSGGIESTGYVGQSNYTSTGGVVTSFSSGFDMPNWSGTLIGSGSITLTLADSATNTWCLSGNVGITGSGAAVVVMGGYKSLSATLDRVRITTSGGNTFDAGSVNVMYS